MRDLSDIFVIEREKNVHRHQTVLRHLPEHIVAERAATTDSVHGGAYLDTVEVNF